MGQVLFNGLELDTAPGRVMTPRTTSERLVAEASRRIDGAARIADVGTGSGAIAIALAVACPEALVWATDVDEQAVALARHNVTRFRLSNRVFVHQCDLLDPVPGPLDAIVANLPYLAERTAPGYSDLRAEPFAAVFAAGDGLGAYRRLIASAATKLAPTGTLLLQLHGGVVAADRQDLAGLHEVLRSASSVALRQAA